MYSYFYPIKKKQYEITILLTIALLCTSTHGALHYLLFVISDMYANTAVLEQYISPKGPHVAASLRVFIRETTLNLHLLIQLINLYINKNNTIGVWLIINYNWDIDYYQRWIINTVEQHILANLWAWVSRNCDLNPF